MKEIHNEDIIIKSAKCALNLCYIPLFKKNSCGFQLRKRLGAYMTKDMIFIIFYEIPMAR